MGSPEVNGMRVGRGRHAARRPVAAILGCVVPAGDVLAAPGAAAPPPVDAGAVLHVVGGLVIVLLFIGLVAWIVRRSGRLQPGVSGEMRILAGISMGPRERIVLLQVGQTQLLVGVAPGRIETLHVLDDPLPVPAAPVASGSFAEQLSALIARVGPARRCGGDGS